MMTPEKSDLATKFNLPDAPAVSDGETDIINSGPAIFSNKIYATMMPQGMRVTFAEVNPASQTPAFRAAILLSFQDTAALAELLQRQLGQLEIVDISQPAGSSGEAT